VLGSQESSGSPFGLSAVFPIRDRCGVNPGRKALCLGWIRPINGQIGSVGRGDMCQSSHRVFSDLRDRWRPGEDMPDLFPGECQTLDEQDQAVLDELVGAQDLLLLAGVSNSTFWVTADHRGTAAGNLELGFGRAQAVKRYVDARVDYTSALYLLECPFGRRGAAQQPTRTSRWCGTQPH
jgi:hypothetical protein